jgi:hypothetical protein
MSTGPVVRTVRLDDFMAKGLEATASAMPPSEKIKADSYRQLAKIYRESINPKMIVVREEIVPDPFGL